MLDAIIFVHKKGKPKVLNDLKVELKWSKYSKKSNNNNFEL